jgi:hypothetical protein
MGLRRKKFHQMVFECMTCYFRHLKVVFEKAGIVITKENKAEADRIIHEIVGVEYKNCPNAWREAKRLIGEDEEAFASELRSRWQKTN